MSSRVIGGSSWVGPNVNQARAGSQGRHRAGRGLKAESCLFWRTPSGTSRSMVVRISPARLRARARAVRTRTAGSVELAVVMPLSSSTAAAGINVSDDETGSTPTVAVAVVVRVAAVGQVTVVGRCAAIAHTVCRRAGTSPPWASPFGCHRARRRERDGWPSWRWVARSRLPRVILLCSNWGERRGVASATGPLA